MRPEIVIVGLGPGPLAQLTPEAHAVLSSSARVLVRLSAHPVCSWLRDSGKDVVSFDLLYATPGATYDDVYELIADAVIKEAGRTGRAIYALPGSPYVFEHTPQLINERAVTEDIAVNVIPGVSFLDVVSSELRISLADVQIYHAITVAAGDAVVDSNHGVLVGSLGAATRPSQPAGENRVQSVCRQLESRFPPDHQVSLVWTPGMPDYATLSRRVLLRDVASTCASTKMAFSALYVPPVIT